MATTIANLGSPAPIGNLLIVDGLNVAFRWKHQNILDFKYDYIRTIESLAKSYKAGTIIRGLRAVSDFEYEFQLAGMNKKLNTKIETMFLMSDIENQIISSKFVKEIANLGGNIDRFVTKSTVKVLKDKF